MTEHTCSLSPYLHQTFSPVQTFIVQQLCYILKHQKKKQKNTTFEDDYSDSLCLKPKLCFRLSFSYHGFLEASSVPGLGQRNATLEKGRLALQM